MAISFNQIPINLRVPGQYLEISNEKAFQGLPGYPAKVLVIGQMLSSGIGTALEPVLITSVDQGNQLAGRGSQLAHMLEAFKKGNSFIEVHAIAQEDDGAGVKAAGAITFGGPATAAGTLNIYLGGRRIRVAVAAADTDEEIATAVAAAITADSDVAVTAAVDGVDGEKVVITARNAGECGNDIDIRVGYYDDERLPSGVTATVTAMTGGSGNPDVTDVLTAIGDEWYTGFVMAYTDTANILAMEDSLETRYGPLKMIDAHMYLSMADTHAGLITAGASRNCPHATIIGSKGSPTPPYEWAATLGAVCAYSLQIDPARPVQTLELPGILAPKITDRFTLDERNLLLYSGISTFKVDADGTVRIERVVTTYQTNPAGADDPSYLDIETMHTLAYLRYDVRTFIALRFPRYKLADNGTDFGRGNAVVTPEVIADALIARFRLWEEIGLVEGFEQFKRDLIVERNISDPNRVDAIIPPDVINQFRVFAAKVEFRL